MVMRIWILKLVVQTSLRDTIGISKEYVDFQKDLLLVQFR